MAYVALSRVRSLDGLFLTAFDPQSLTVSVRFPEEVNRLRLQFRKDLSLYKIPRAAGRKRKLTGVAQAPSAKRVIPNPSRSTKDCVTTHTIPRATARKRRLPSVAQAPSATRARPSTSKTTNEDEECLITHTETHDSPFKFATECMPATVSPVSCTN